MINLDNITIVSVAGIRAQKALKAIQYSCKGINYGACKLFTPESLKDDKIEIINIDNMNYEQYNHFIVYELYKFINTDYVLIIQDDGFVINPDKWDNKFLEYDYIGAPFGLPQDDFSYRDAFGNIVRVGNGGFSLRTKKILQLATSLNLKWEPFHGYYNEDGFFVCKNRHIYEEHGFKFAPIEVAAHFSYEVPLPENRGITTFGFHGREPEKLNLLNF